MVNIRNSIRLVALFLRYLILAKVYRMDIARSARISLGVKLDKTNPKGIHIAEESYIASGTLVLTHDFSRGLHADTFIGKQCFIGANAIIMCGVCIGDNVIVGAGSVVTRNVPSHCIVAGNPAKIIRGNIQTGKFGQFLN